MLLAIGQNLFFNITPEQVVGWLQRVDLSRLLEFPHLGDIKVRDLRSEPCLPLRIAPRLWPFPRTAYEDQASGVGRDRCSPLQGFAGSVRRPRAAIGRLHRG